MKRYCIGALMAIILIVWLVTLPLFVLGTLCMSPFFICALPLCWVISLIQQHQYWHGQQADNCCWYIVSRIPWHLWFKSLTADPLSIETPALICSHPHGWVCAGIMLGNHFHPKGPKTYFAVAPLLFWIPIFGWFLYSLRCIPATRRHIKQTLTHSSVILVPGGVPEIVCAESPIIRLFLEERYGFARLADTTNTPLIAAWTEGELFTYERITLPFLEARIWLSHQLNLPFTFPYLWGWHGTWLPKPVKLHVSYSKPLMPLQGKDTKERYMRVLRKLRIRVCGNYGESNCAVD